MLIQNLQCSVMQTLNLHANLNEDKAQLSSGKVTKNDAQKVKM